MLATGMLVFGKVIVCVFSADLLSGFFHWLEDAYGREHWPVTGKLITGPNILHHHQPAHFTRHGWFKSAQVLLVMGVVVLLLAFFLGRLSWEVALVVAIGVNANQLHKWAHRTRGENGRLISSLQDVGLVQSRRHHAGHHRAGKNTHYCVVTNYLNPLLDGVGLWAFLERVIFSLLGVRRRPDSSVSAAHREIRRAYS